VPTNKELGRGIRRLRQVRRLSLEDLAFKAGLHSTYLSSIERGKANPTWRVVCGLATGFDITIGQLVRVAEAEALGGVWPGV
jgi:transcriptional regulator with XRE-family HTH domain